MIRVLIAEGSPATRDLFIRLLRVETGFDVVGVVDDGEAAVAYVGRLHPDVILMDIHLPRLDGIGATRRIMSEMPTPIVLIGSSTERTEARHTFDALRAGALTVVDSPPDPSDATHVQVAQEFLQTVRLMADVKVVRRRQRVYASSPSSTATSPPCGERGDDVRPALIAIAASTGGPEAIRTLLRSLGRDVGIPILIVQHMSPGFLGGLVDWLTENCPQPVQIATQGVELRGGIVYLAPDACHLMTSRHGTVVLSDAPPMGQYRPSADVLFQSVAESYQAKAVGVILTGMGDDGVAGLRHMRDVGAMTIAQDGTTSAVYGMPQAAAIQGSAGRVLPLAAIGPTIRRALGLPTYPRSHD